MNCVNCGSPLPDGSQFCMHCGAKAEVGTQVNAASMQSLAPSKRNPKQITIIASVSVALLILFSFLCFQMVIYLQPKPPYAMLNTNNGGRLAYGKDCIVFIGKPDFSDNSVLLKARKDGSDKQILLDEKNISSLFVDNRDVYYVKNDNNQYFIKKIGLDGKNNQEIFKSETNSGITNLFIEKNKVYFQHDNGVYQMDKNGEASHNLLPDEKVKRYCVDNGTIYYTTKTAIKKYNGDSIEIASIPGATNLCVNLGYLYFNKDKGGIGRIKLSDNKSEMLGGNSVLTYTIYGNKIYYTETLSKSDLRELLTLLDKKEGSMVELLLTFSGKIYAMDTKGVSADVSSSIASNLYTTPSKMFSTMTAVAEIKALD